MLIRTIIWDIAVHYYLPDLMIATIHSYDLESMNGKTIGVYENAKENIRRLKEFLAINGLVL